MLTIFLNIYFKIKHALIEFVNQTKNILTDVKERFEPKETEEVQAFKKTVSSATSVLLESITIILSNNILKFQ